MCVRALAAQWLRQGADELSQIDSSVACCSLAQAKLGHQPMYACEGAITDSPVAHALRSTQVARPSYVR